MHKQQNLLNGNDSISTGCPQEEKIKYSIHGQHIDKQEEKTLERKTRERERKKEKKKSKLF